MSPSVRERAYSLAIFNGAPEMFEGPSNGDGHGEWFARAPMAVAPATGFYMRVSSHIGYTLSRCILA